MAEGLLVTILDRAHNHHEDVTIARATASSGAGDPVLGSQFVIRARVQRAWVLSGADAGDDTVLLTLSRLAVDDRVWLAEDDINDLNASRKVKSVIERRSLDGYVTGYKAAV